MDLSCERETSDLCPMESPHTSNALESTPASEGLEDGETSENILEPDEELFASCNDSSVAHSHSPIHGTLSVTSTRPTRESVLQRLSEALLRRSLTKVGLPN